MSKQPKQPNPGPKPAHPNGPKRPGLERVWTATDGGPGPASWRRHDESPEERRKRKKAANYPYYTGNARGLVRRKGDKNPRNHRLDIDPEVLKDDKHKQWRPLADLNAAPQKKNGKGKKGSGSGSGSTSGTSSSGRSGGKKGCQIM